jgi:hypothetical protein
MIATIATAEKPRAMSAPKPAFWEADFRGPELDLEDPDLTVLL